MSPKYASINPDDFSKGGVLNDVDVEFIETKFVTGDDAVEQTEGMAKYRNVEESLFFAANLKVLDGEMKGEEMWQYWSSGKLLYFEPSEDGRHAKPVGSAEKLSDGCNAYTLFASIVNAGYPRDKFSDDVGIFEGMRAHVINVEQKKLAGINSNPEDGARARTVLTVENILEPFPWDEVTKKRKGKGTTAKAAAKDADVEDDLEEVAKTTIVELLVGADGGPIKKTTLYQKALRALAKHPDKKAIIKNYIADDDWLEASEDWEFDGKQLEIG